MKLSTVTLYFLFSSIYANLLFGQNVEFVGKYYFDNLAGDESSVVKKLDLKDCGVFFFNIEPYDYDITYSGYWTVQNDTLLLKTTKIIYCISELAKTDNLFYTLRFDEVFFDSWQKKVVITINAQNDTIDILKTQKSTLKIPFSNNLKKIGFKGGLYKDIGVIIDLDKVKSNNILLSYGRNQDVLFDTCYIIKNINTLQNCSYKREILKRVKSWR